MAQSTESSRRLSASTRLANARSRIQSNKFAYYLVLPIVLYLVLLVWYPWLQGFVMSFYDWPLFGEKKFIGLGNYTYLLSWEVFWTSVKATLIYGLQTIGHLIFGTLMALIVWSTRNRWLTTVISIIFLIPYVVPPLVTGTLFRYILHPSIGPFFKILVQLGVLSQPIYWLSNGDAALVVITLIGVWTWTPLVFLLVISSLEGIPADYYETARVYGANKWERFRYITYPQIKTTLLVAAIIRIIWNFGKISQPFVMTRGGPGFQTSILGVLLYRLAWTRQELGLAFATGILLGILSLVFVVGFIRKFEQEEGDVQI